jgi:hypothetical protein
MSTFWRPLDFNENYDHNYESDKFKKDEIDYLVAKRFDVDQEKRDKAIKKLVIEWKK